MLNSSGNGTSNWQAENPVNSRDEGVYVNDLAQGEVLELDTLHHHYRLVKRNKDHFRISGHPQFCPDPIDVEVEGSFANKWPSVPRPGFIGRGMHLMFKHPAFDLVTTSEIREIRKPH